MDYPQRNKTQVDLGLSATLSSRRQHGQPLTAGHSEKGQQNTDMHEDRCPAASQVLHANLACNKDN